MSEHLACHVNVITGYVLIRTLFPIREYPDLDTLRTLRVLGSGKVMIPNGTQRTIGNQAPELS